MQDNLREQIRLLKALNQVSYCDIADRLKIHRNSFYNWLKGYYNLSEDNAKRLQIIVQSLKDKTE